MFPDSKNPFTAAPSNGSASSPFQPTEANGAPPTNGNAVPSPFGSPAQATPAQSQPAQVTPTAIPEQKKSPEPPSSPFAVVPKPEQGNPTPFEPALVEPTEGFAANEAPPSRLVEAAPVAAAAPVARMSSTQTPAAMPEAPSASNDRNDPFAAPSPVNPSPGATAPAKRGDFVLPTEAENAASASGQAPVAQVAQPSQAAPVVAAQVAAPVATAAAPAVTGETAQLVLRAIFGVTRELDREEILQRARTLPGIRNLHIVEQSEGAAMASLRGSIQRMGFGDQASLALTTSGGVVDFIEEPGTTLAVLHEGGYAAGVRETLIIVARELSRLG